MAQNQAEIDAFHNSAFPNANEMRKYLTSDSESWDKVWANGLTPWEAGAVDIQPPLRMAIESGEVPFPKEGKALVPGCGRGFDTIYLASALGWKTVLGYDISTTAIAAANDFLKSKNVPPSVAASVKFDAIDFFKLELPEEEKFDLIYDYTFYVAIPPSMRPAWGAQIQSLIKSGGYLITLMFPHVPEPYKLGPPFWSSFENYVEVLGGSNGSGGANGWEIVYNKIPPPEIQSEVHKGKDRIVVWRRVFNGAIRFPYKEPVWLQHAGQVLASTCRIRHAHEPRSQRTSKATAGSQRKGARHQRLTIQAHDYWPLS